MKNESQYGLLLLQQYLYEHTDDQHPASVADILAFWREHGIQAGRKSVYSAIEVLQTAVWTSYASKAPRIDTSWVRGCLNCRS